MRLTLSGGGFRATLFHLGVVRYLREQGDLKNVTEIYSVSGGSVLAAHLVLNWEKYTAESDKIFADAAQELVDFCQSDVRGRIVRRWLFSWALIVLVLLLPPSIWVVLRPGMLISLLLVVTWLAVAIATVKFHHRLSLIDSLRRSYDRLYGAATLRMLGEEKSPKLFLLASNLTTGGLACFTAKGIDFHGTESDPAAIEQDNLSIALGVAASSAFPPLFSPVQISRSLVNVDVAHLQHPHYLSDGGVFDNLGMRAAQFYTTADGSPLTASSAERRFEWQVAESFAFPPTRFVRATDILMQRVSTLEMGDVAWAEDTRYVKLSEDRSGGHLPDTLQRGVRNIRTDLDRFTPLEIQLLVYRGYCAARYALSGQDDKPDGVATNKHGVPIAFEPPRWLPMPSGHKKLSVEPAKALRASTGSRYRIWHFKDWTSWFLPWVLALNLLLMTVSILHPALLLVESLYSRAIPAAGISGIKWHVARASSGAAGDITRGRRVLQRELLTMQVPAGRCTESAHIIIYSESFDSAIGRRLSTRFDLEIKPQLESFELLSLEAFVISGDKEYLKGPLDSDTTGPGSVVVSCPPLKRGDRVVVLAVLCSHGPEGTLDQDISLGPFVQLRARD